MSGPADSIAPRDHSIRLRRIRTPTVREGMSDDAVDNQNTPGTTDELPGAAETDRSSCDLIEITGAPGQRRMLPRFTPLQHLAKSPQSRRHVVKMSVGIR